MAKKKILEITEELLAGFMAENGYELYHCEYVKEGRGWFLRVYVDIAASKGYVGTEDCEKVSRYLSEKLDETNPIEQNYYLEVSSPGMDRPLIKPAHYERFVGEEVEIRLYKGKDGTKRIEGVLKTFERDGEDGGYRVTVLDRNDKEWELQLAEIAKARLAVMF